MINEITDLLKIDPYYGVSENIEIAKGYNKIPLSIKEGYEQFKRKREWRKR